jgi:hypothetical protein
MHTLIIKGNVVVVKRNGIKPSFKSGIIKKQRRREEASSKAKHLESNKRT